MSGQQQRERSKGYSGFPCPECGGCEYLHDLEKGDCICATCGLIVSENRIEDGSQWRAFTIAEKYARSRRTSGFTCSVCGGREVAHDPEKDNRFCPTCGLVIP